MKKQLFKLDIDYNFFLLALVATVKDYKFCWKLNKYLHHKFKRQENVELVSEHDNELLHFNVYSYRSKLEMKEFFLITNKCHGQYLVPEVKEADYFFMVKGNCPDHDRRDIISQLKKEPTILTFFEIKPETLKSKQNLIFE